MCLPYRKKQRLNQDREAEVEEVEEGHADQSVAHDMKYINDPSVIDLSIIH